MPSKIQSVLGFVRGLPRRARGALGVLTITPEAPLNLAGALDDWAARVPGRTLIWFEGRRITYGEMHGRVARRARSLHRLGVRRGDVVALVMSNAPDFLVSAWAIAKLGAVASLVNTQLSGASLTHAVRSVSPRAIVAGREHLPAIDAALADEPALAGVPRVWVETRSEPGTEPVEHAQDLASLDDEAGPLPPTVETRAEELAAYIYTSGTTGLPKPGRITHGRCYTAADGFGGFTLGLSPDDVLYVCLPLFHSSGFLVGAASALRQGATIALSRKLSVRRFWDEVGDSGATCFVYIGEICRYLLAAPPHPRERAHAIRRIVGNGMRPDVWRPFVERFEIGVVHEFYGATEGNVNMTNLFGIEGSVGRMPPLPGYDNAFLAKFDRDTEAPVRDARGRCVECAVGEEGELLGRIDPSKSTMRFEGYLGEEATRSKILRDVKEPGDAYFRSGDLLRRDAWGFYYFVDRIGDTFRFKGENVSTNEVGDVCSSFEGVELANVYGVAIPHVEGRAGMVALSLVHGASFSPERFYEHVRGALPSYAAPLFVRLLPEAKVTVTFKLKKTDLVDEGFDPARTEDLLFYRDDAASTYQVLDAEAFARIHAGSIRF
jgi:fatty-acyl-CoA synthase